MLGYFLGAVAKVLDIVLNGVLLIILVNALLSWVRPDPSNPIVQFLERVSDAVCNPIRRLFPTVLGGLDLAPLIAMLAITFLRMFVVRSLEAMSLRM